MSLRCRFVPMNGKIAQQWFLNERWAEEPGYLWHKKDVPRVIALVKAQGVIVR